MSPVSVPPSSPIWTLDLALYRVSASSSQLSPHYVWTCPWRLNPRRGPRHFWRVGPDWEGWLLEEPKWALHRWPPINGWWGSERKGISPHFSFPNKGTSGIPKWKRAEHRQRPLAAGICLESKSIVAQLCLTLSDPMDIHGILQARTLEWVTIPFSRGSSWPRNWTQISWFADRFFTIWATWRVKFFCCCLVAQLMADFFGNPWTVLERQAEFHYSTQDEFWLSCPNSAGTLLSESEMERNPDVTASIRD